MPGWECGIAGCGETFATAEDLLVHQIDAHDPHECRVCGAVVPEGFYAIRHMSEEHTRAEYVRHYDADSDAIRVREAAKDAIEDAVDDVDAIRDRFDETSTATAD